MQVVLLRRSRACVTFTCIESPHSTRQPRSFTDAPYIDEFVLFVELDLEQPVYPCMCDEALQHLRRKLQSAAVECLDHDNQHQAKEKKEKQHRRHREPEAQARTGGRGHE